MRRYWGRMPLVRALSLALAIGGCGVTDNDQPAVSAVEVTPGSLQLSTGATAALDARVVDGEGNTLEGRRIVWASANPGVATVSDRGVVAAVSAGSAEIAATAEGKSGLASITVLALPPTVASVRVAPATVDLFVASTQGLVATAYDNKGVAIGGRTVVWTTNNAGVASVSQTGQVTGLTPGTAVITAVIDGQAGHANVAVKLVPVARVTVSPADVTVEAGKSTQLIARAFDSSGNAITGRTVTWTSSDTRFVTVDETGLARAVRRGSAVVTATVEGKNASATVRVN